MIVDTNGGAVCGNTEGASRRRFTERDPVGGGAIGLFSG